MFPRLLLAGLVATLALGGCGWFSSAPPAGIAARVNGQQISTGELDNALSQQTAAHEVQGVQRERLRLGLLAQMVDRELLLQHASRLGIAAPDGKVKSALRLAQLKQPKESEDQLRRQVADRIVLQELFQREVGDKIHVTDSEIAEFYSQNAAMFNVAEPRYHVLSIEVTGHAGRVANLSGDNAKTRAAARKKIALLEGKLQQGADFATLAQEYSEDPNTAQSGGDLGLIPESALMTQTPARLRQAILLLQLGQVSPPVHVGDSYYLLKLIGKESAGKHPVTDPQVHKKIHDLLFSQREQILKSALVTELRNRAHIQNYLARRILAGPP